MTREEAIERLNIHKSTSVFVDSIAEAIDMAIEALQADVVSREEAIQAIDRCRERKNKEIEQLREFYSQKPTIPMFAESEEAYKAWTGEEMSGTSGKVYDRFAERWIDESDIDPFADPARYSEPQTDRPTMTKEVREALQILKCERWYMSRYSEEYKEALDMAIEALQREIPKNPIVNYVADDELMKPADAVQGWITDRNPTEDGTYLVTIVDEDGGFVCELHYGEPLLPICKVNGSCWYDSDDEFGDCPYYDIIAWMPLPKPYKGGDTK